MFGRLGNHEDFFRKLTMDEFSVGLAPVGNTTDRLDSPLAPPDPPPDSPKANRVGDERKRSLADQLAHPPGQARRKHIRERSGLRHGWK